MIGSLLSEAPLWALLLLQSTACIAAGLLASYLLRRCPARAHHALTIALIASVLTPAAYLLARHFDLGLLPYQPRAVEESQRLTPVVTDVLFIDASISQPMDYEPAATDLIPPMTTPAAVEELRTAAVPWTTIGLACWAIGSTALFARLLLQFGLGLRLLRTSEPVEDSSLPTALHAAETRLGIRQPVAIARHPKVNSPVIWCWSRPPVLLVHHADPALPGHTDWTAIFCHELAQLKRRDHHSGLFAELLAAAVPWHPLIWCARARLARLSEHACDDWVLAAGQPAADYAESLLHLSPQRRVAFLPTVVGKERTMKARIYRIVKDQQGNPRISRRWTLALTGLLMLATTALALAQREPAPREPSDPMVQGERDEAPQPMRQTALTGRRNVLQRLLDQLVAQAEETERTLQQRGDEPDEETEVLRAELRTLHDQIGAIERQLDTLNRRGRPVPPQRPLLDQQRQRPGAADLLDDLRRRQERIQSRLAEIDDPDHQEARELREQLARLDVQIRQAEARARARAARSDFEMRQAESRQRAESARRAAARRAAEQERRDREPDARVRDLRNRLLELDGRIAEMARSLQQSDDPDSEESRDRRATLEQSEGERAEVREELERLDPEMHVWELERGLSMDEEFVSEIARQIAGMERGLLDLEQQGRGDTAEAAELRRNLARLQSQTRAIQARIEAQRHLLSRVRSERDPDERRTERRATSSSRIDPYGDPYARTMTRARVSSPQAPPDVQRQVEELRGQVHGLNQQIQQMREMIQQLLERRDQPTPEPQPMKPY